MSIQIWFWLCIFLAVIFGGVSVTPTLSAKAPWAGGVSGLCAFIALVLLGYHEFGGPIK